jgi:hypothetical protein
MNKNALQTTKHVEPRNADEPDERSDPAKLLKILVDKGYSVDMLEEIELDCSWFIPPDGYGDGLHGLVWWISLNSEADEVEFGPEVEEAA